MACILLVASSPAREFTIFQLATRAVPNGFLVTVLDVGGLRQVVVQPSVYVPERRTLSCIINFFDHAALSRFLAALTKLGLEF